MLGIQGGWRSEGGWSGFSGLLEPPLDEEEGSYMGRLGEDEETNCSSMACPLCGSNINLPLSALSEHMRNCMAHRRREGLAEASSEEEGDEEDEEDFTHQAIESIRETCTKLGSRRMIRWKESLAHLADTSACGDETPLELSPAPLALSLLFAPPVSPFKEPTGKLALLKVPADLNLSSPVMKPVKSSIQMPASEAYTPARNSQPEDLKKIPVKSTRCKRARVLSLKGSAYAGSDLFSAQRRKRSC
jgi:hypothetical protein